MARPGVGTSKTNPEHWTDFATAAAIAANERGLWPYMVLSDGTPFTLFDVDRKPRREARPGVAAETTEEYEARIQRAEQSLQRLREMFPRRYEARSKSGNGFHIIVRGKFEGTGGKGRGEWAEVEAYTRAHGVALTGHVEAGHDTPATYPAETIQAIRDTIKGGPPHTDTGDATPDLKSHGNVRREWARQVLGELAAADSRPDYPDWRDMASAVFGGVGVETGIELLEEFFPEEKEGEYRRMAKSLQWFASWETLRSFGVNPSDPETLLALMPDLGPLEEEENTRTGEKTADPFPITRVGDMEGVAEALDFVEGVLTEGGASVIYGPSNCGKSFWILDLAACVATGANFRGVLEVDRGAVVYVALEGAYGVRNRIEALKRAGRLPGDAPLFVVFAPVSLMNTRHAGRLAASVKHAAEQSGLPCRLVILDTLARAMAGGDENSGKDMMVAVKSIDAIRAATGAHVCVVHHCGKDEARGARGHSSLRAAVDTEIEVSRPEAETISTVRVTKQRDLQAGEAMPFSLKVVTLGSDRRGKPITSCVVAHEDPAAAGKPGRAGRTAKCTAAEMLRYLPAATVKEWQETVKTETGLGETQFYAHKKRLEATGRIRREDGTKRIVRNDPADAMPDLEDPGI
ncbi:MAG: helicase RepA family protein [Akkermansiaceae bacterium]|nr:helicase RepA family protein [Akkermansiaceae bacterium]